MKKQHILSMALVLLFALAVGIVPAAAVVDDTAPFSVNDQRNYEKDNFMLKYDVNSSFTLPAGWEVIEDYGNFIPGLLHLKLPANITVRDAINYFATIDGVIYAEPNYVSSPGPSQTDAKRIYSGTRTDRIDVYYIDAAGEHLPWDVLYEYDYSSPEFEEEVLLQIPASMSLVEAIEYCSNCSNVYVTSPGEEYIQTVVLGNSYDINGIITDEIWVLYKRDSAYRLPWSLISEFSSDSGHYCRYKIPDNMTLAEAYAYCNTIDDIVSVAFEHIMYPQGDSNIVPSTHTLFPVFGTLLGILSISALIIRKRK